LFVVAAEQYRTEKALNEEQAVLCRGYGEFKLDLKQPGTIRELVPVDLPD